MGDLKPNRTAIVTALCSLYDRDCREDVVPVLAMMNLTLSQARKIIATQNTQPGTHEHDLANQAKMMLCFAEIDEMKAARATETVLTPPQTGR